MPKQITVTTEAPADFESFRALGGFVQQAGQQIKRYLCGLLGSEVARHVNSAQFYTPPLTRKHVEVCGWSVVARGLLCCPSELAVLFPPIVFDDRAEESDGIRPVSTPRHSLVLAPPGDE